MRSRYTAYAVQNVDYVLDTHDPETRDEIDEADVRNWSERSEWLELEILDTKNGGEKDEEGEVEFIARYLIDGKVRNHRERSTFKKTKGRWYLHDGNVIGGTSVKREGPKVGRNDPCPCGSGKKHKKCCGRPGAARP